jgi:ATP-dependent DNA ligase
MPGPPAELSTTYPAETTVGRTKRGLARDRHTGQVATASVAITPVPPAPMLATAAALPANSTGYCFEAKWDGER